MSIIDIMRSPPKKFKSGALGKRDLGLEPDIVVYNAVLNACVRRKQWEGAFWVLQQMKEKGVQPSTATYGLVMEVMLACGKYNLVHEFFKKVQKSSIPNALVYKVLVNTFWREGKTEEAVLAVKDIGRRGIVGSAALYYDLARYLCTSGRCQEALDLVIFLCLIYYVSVVHVCLKLNIKNIVL
ncbi:pentatricopeptide repeat-containing protein At1g30610, chloroplastic [Populus alba]|uniref:pentatricopeptide repeat-containing protein At1g30610, chloroplastic n=1 Tax=Populus alba TaxID=43335 RepID=UPI003CC7040E